jgi:Periplasmic copper-binding protein (NosD)
MLRYRYLLLAVVPLLAVQPLLAVTVQVGNCLTGPKNYTTISAAVAAVPSGSIVDVCPGTYAEQVAITIPLTLQGVTSGTANQAVVTVPSGGLTANVTSMFSESVAAQILVSGPGPVTIRDIAVDGTGGDLGCSSWVAGIFYGSGSSGTVNGVRASSQVDTTCGVGIWAENGGSSNESITITNSSVYNADSAGIFVGSGPTPTLTATVNNNVVNTSAAVAAIDADSVNGLVENSTVSNATFGVYDIASGVTVTSNAITGTTYGIYLGSGGTASSNRVSGSSSDGILLGASGATLTSNRIMSSTTAGVELGCFTATVNSNIINDAPIGFDAAPLATDLTTNSLFNTATTITNGCAFAAVSAKPKQQWHTPATPFGTRTK